MSVNYIENSFPRTPWKLECTDVMVTWTIYGNDFPDYLRDFHRVNETQSIEEQLKRLQGNEGVSVLDLLSTPHALRTLQQTFFSKNQFTGVAVGLSENRSGIERLEDDNKGIRYIPGNIRHRQTWEEIAKLLPSESVDLILERGFGGLHFIPNRTLFYGAVLQRLWQLLSPNNGMALLQIPPLYIFIHYGIDIKGWLSLLKNQGIEYEYDPIYKSKDANQEYGVLRLVKKGNVQLPGLEQVYNKSVI